MSRYATWRRGANDPTTAWRWVLGAGRATTYDPQELSRESRRRKLVCAGGVSGLLSIGAIGFFPKALPLVPTILGFGLRDALSLRSKPRTIEGGGPGESVWVRTTIRDQGECQTGHDEGWLISSEGWLLFEGERTAFALKRGAVEQRRFEPKGRLRLEDGRDVEFNLIGERPSLWPLKRIVELWESTSIPEGDPVLPPRETHPEVWGSRAALALLAAVVTVPSLFVFGVINGWQYFAGWMAILFVRGLLRSVYTLRRLRESLVDFGGKSTAPEAKASGTLAG